MLCYTYTYTCEKGVMHKKLTISIDEQVYEGLYAVVGKGSISQFIEDLVRPHVITDELDAAYKLMAEDKTRETEALAWTEALIGDIDR
jgi:predicted CopG family antitoxin